MAPQRRFALRPCYWTAWGVLGAPRLHCTIATGEVISKEAAGEYAAQRVRAAVAAAHTRRLLATGARSLSTASPCLSDSGLE